MCSAPSLRSSPSGSPPSRTAARASSSSSTAARLPNGLRAALSRAARRARLADTRDGHAAAQDRAAVPGRPLRAAAHALAPARAVVAMRCGYPASSIRERIYVDYEDSRFGLLLYTASPDAEGTLGGLVAQARHIGVHLARCAACGRLVLQRPRLRPALAGRGDGGTVAARCRVPRLRAHRRDLVRDAQRLPRPRARRADACRFPDAAFFPAVP